MNLKKNYLREPWKSWELTSVLFVLKSFHICVLQNQGQLKHKKNYDNSQKKNKIFVWPLLDHSLNNVGTFHKMTSDLYYDVHKSNTRHWLKTCELYLYESSQKMTYDLIFTFTKIAYSVDLNVHQNDLPPLFWRSPK